MTSQTEKISKLDSKVELMYKLYLDIKYKTTKGKLRVNDNHAFINNNIIISSHGRFVTKEEQKSNLDLWVFMKDNDLVESLYLSKTLWQKTTIGLSKVCAVLIVIIIVLFIVVMWLLFKLP